MKALEEVRKGLLHVTSRSWKAVRWPPQQPALGESDLGAEDGGWKLGLGPTDAELASFRGVSWCLLPPAALLSAPNSF